MWQFVKMYATLYMKFFMFVFSDEKDFVVLPVGEAFMLK